MNSLYRCGVESSRRTGLTPGVVSDDVNGLRCGFVFGVQVTIMNSRGEELCGGVLLDRFSVLTAASCLLLNSNIEPHNFYVVAGTDLNKQSVNLFWT